MEKKMINKSYTGLRPDIFELIPSNIKKVLDFGCSTGELGGTIKAESQAYVVGIEIDRIAAKEAKNKLDEVYVGDIEELDLNSFDKNFDCIIFADVLEHVVSPLSVLNKCKLLLNDNGVVIISLPNVQHVTVLLNLIFGLWPQRDRGIFDRTHLRFFTRKSANLVFDNAGLKIDCLSRQYRFIDRPHKINQFAKFFAIPFIRNFLTYQLIFRLKKYED